MTIQMHSPDDSPQGFDPIEPDNSDLHFDDPRWIDPLPGRAATLLDESEDDQPSFRSTLNFRMGYSEGYSEGVAYAGAVVRNGVFFYDAQHRFKSAVMKIRWRIERAYWKHLRPNDIPF